MNARNALMVVAVLICFICTATPSYADISNASVLFLRIPVGARSLGMGEAFTAMADDATATHWNPAGLGAYPFSSMWIESSVPTAYRPIRAIAAVRNGTSGERYSGYDIWAISPKGLIRFDNKSWQTGELFRTRTDQTVKGIVTKYFNINDDVRADSAVARVAAANSNLSYDDLSAYIQAVLAAAPIAYRDTAVFRAVGDSLLALYSQCRINWLKVSDARGVWTPGEKAKALTLRDMDRIFVALDHARYRFIPEELNIPYSAIVNGEPTVLASSGTQLYVGTTNGLIMYNGRSWKTLSSADGLPSNHVTSLCALTNIALIGTAQGAVYYDGAGIARFKDTTGLPADTIMAITGQKVGDYYAVVNHDLYHFDGIRWTNTIGYTVSVDDTPDVIATKFAVYGSPVEKAAYMEKLLAIPQAEAPKADSAGPADSTATPAPVSAFRPGDQIVVPYLAQIKGNVTTLKVVGGAIWVGTEYGVLYFDKNRWHTPGYREAKVTEGQSLTSFVQDFRGARTDTSVYRAFLLTINDLAGDSLAVGQTLKVRANPAAASVNSIASDPKRVLVATGEGLIEYAEGKWSRADVRGLGTTTTQTIFTHQDEVWFSTTDRVIVYGRAFSEIAPSHSKWLPTLANDLYHENWSFVTHSGKLGTFGISPTFMSYGTFSRTNADDPKVIGTFDAFDIAPMISFGASLTNKLKGGLSAKVIYSRLAPQGAGEEQGAGTSTGFALDFGFLYQQSPRLTWGLAVTNLGPKMTYIDAAQADPLPANFALGFAYKLKQSDFLKWTMSFEINKMLPGTKLSHLRSEFREVILNAGTELTYANIIAGRAGYIYDQEGNVKALTLGAGLSIKRGFWIDLAYIPSSGDVPLGNTLLITPRYRW
ncbi:MAG: PorV/PorQ family protein [candidate division Zixibacteria bacterium]|nr:PorV/PorQ family protein [candidate division Zixibacteria bacterium]